MANWDRKYSNGSWYTAWNCRLIYELNYQGANYSHVSLYLQTWSDGSQYTQWGLWDGRIYVNGGQVARETPTRTIANGIVQLTSWGGDIGHDVNGNLYMTIGDYINAPANEATYADIGWTLPRIGLAPPITSITADTFTTNTARLGVEIGGYGHGTIAAMHMHYRKLGDSVWSTTADQNDVGGYNYWTITGLTTNTTYQYLASAWNNNGDINDSGIQTFSTKSGIKMILPSGTVEDRTVKQVLPSGVVSNRVATKIK